MHGDGFIKSKAEILLELKHFVELRDTSTSVMTETFKKPPRWYAEQAAVTRQGVLLQHANTQKLKSQ